MRHKGGGHKQHYRIVDFSATRTASPAKVERLEYDPNRSAQPRAAAVRRRRAPLHHRAARRRRRHAADVGRRSPDQAGQLPAAAQHPGRHDDPLRRDAAGQGRADRALGRRRRCSSWRAKASTRSCGCAPAKSARCTSTAARSIGEVGNEEHSLRSIGKAGANRWRGIRPTVRGICDEPGRPPARRALQRRRPSGLAVGHADQGLQDAHATSAPTR